MEQAEARRKDHSDVARKTVKTSLAKPSPGLLRLRADYSVLIKNLQSSDGDLSGSFLEKYRELIDRNAPDMTLVELETQAAKIGSLLYAFERAAADRRKTCDDRMLVFGSGRGTETARRGRRRIFGQYSVAI